MTLTKFFEHSNRDSLHCRKALLTLWLHGILPVLVRSFLQQHISQNAVVLHCMTNSHQSSFTGPFTVTRPCSG